MSAAGTEKVLHSFAGKNDGMFVVAGVIRDNGGNLYGTTYWGGAYHNSFKCLEGCGTLFKVDARGQETILINFGDSGHPGGALRLPDDGLIFDDKGNL